MKKILLSTIALVGIVFVLSSESQAGTYSSSYTKYNPYSETFTTYGDGYTTTSKYNPYSETWSHDTHTSRW